MEFGTLKPENSKSPPAMANPPPPPPPSSTSPSPLPQPRPFSTAPPLLPLPFTSSTSILGRPPQPLLYPRQSPNPLSRPFLPPHHQPSPTLRPQPRPSGPGPRPFSNGGPARVSPAPHPHPKVNSFPATLPLPEYNNYKEMREKTREDASLVMVHGRKVRIHDGASSSLYALCRSWVQNGQPQEIQPILGDSARLLPKPLPIPPLLASTKDEAEDRDGKQEDEEVTARDLLNEHIRNAKRTRARLGAERRHRINRYKQRLTLLLPLPLEQEKNVTGSGN